MPYHWKTDPMNLVGLLIDAKLRMPEKQHKGFLHVVVDGRNDMMTYEMILANRWGHELYWLEWELNPYVAERARKEINENMLSVPKEICTDIDLQRMQEETRIRNKILTMNRFSRKAKRGPKPVKKEDPQGTPFYDSIMDLRGKPLNQKSIEQAVNEIVSHYGMPPIQIENRPYTGGVDEDLDKFVKDAVLGIEEEIGKQATEFTKKYQERLDAIDESKRIPIVKPIAKITDVRVEAGELKITAERIPQTTPYVMPEVPNGTRFTHQVWRMQLTEQESKEAMHKLGYTELPASNGSGRRRITWRGFLCRVMQEKYFTNEMCKQLVRDNIIPRYPYLTNPHNRLGIKGRQSQKLRRDMVTKSLLATLKFAGLEFVRMEDLIKPHE